MKKLSAKEVYKRLKFKESMQKKVAKAQKAIELAELRLETLQDTCPHYDSEFVNRGNGDYGDGGAYWRNYTCHDCGKTWETDQSYELYKKYPYAVDKTYDRYR